MNDFYGAPAAPQSVKKHAGAFTLGIISLVCGICAVAICFIGYIGLPLSVCAIVTGALSLKRVRTVKQAKAGLILGTVAAVISVIALLIFILIKTSHSPGMPYLNAFDMQGFNA